MGLTIPGVTAKRIAHRSPKKNAPTGRFAFREERQLENRVSGRLSLVLAHRHWIPAYAGMTN